VRGLDVMRCPSGKSCVSLWTARGPGVVRTEDGRRVLATVLYCSINPWWRGGDLSRHWGERDDCPTAKASKHFKTRGHMALHYRFVPTSPCKVCGFCGRTDRYIRGPPARLDGLYNAVLIFRHPATISVDTLLSTQG
jgi:hypothetical protein